MSYVGLHATRWAWSVPVSSSSERLVLLALAKHDSDDDELPYPSAETIAKETRLNRKTVFSAIASLCEAGFIVRSVKTGQGRRNQYELNFNRTENGTMNVPKTERTEIGTYQKRDVPKTGHSTSQKRDDERTENGTLNVPFTGHEYRREERREKRSEERSFMSSPDDENPRIDTNPNAEPIDDVPFPDFEEPSSDELFVIVEDPKTKAEPETQPEAKPKAPKTTRGTRLTIKTLPDEWRAWMAKHFPKYDPDLVFAGFHDYWIGVSGAKGVKLDWFATFRNHVRGIPEWKQKNFIKKDCEQETLPNSNEWTQARRLREGYGWATTY